MTALTEMTAKFEAAETKSATTTAEMVTLKTEFEQMKTASEAKDATIVDLTNKVAEFEQTATDITTLKDSLAVFEQKEADAITAKRTEQFEAMLKLVPLGQKDTDEKKTAMRAEFDTDAISFALKTTAFERLHGTGEEGAEFEGGDADTSATGGAGVYDPVTNTFAKVGA